MSKVSKTEVQAAYRIIKAVIDIELNKRHIKYKASSSAPQSYKKMRDCFDALGYFLVYDGGDHGMMGKEYNIKFRALHDAMHYAYGISFKFGDEKRLSTITANLFAKAAFNNYACSRREIVLIRSIIDAEIRGQIEHFEFNKCYVEDQSSFILSYLNAM